MSFRTLYFDLWKSRGRNVRRKLLRDSLLVFLIVLIIVVVSGMWQYQNLRNNLLEETTSHSLNEAIEKYEKLISDEEKVFEFLNILIADTNISETDVSVILDATLRSHPRIHAISVLQKEGDVLFSVQDSEFVSTGKISKDIAFEEHINKGSLRDKGWSSPRTSTISNEAVICLSNEIKNGSGNIIVLELNLRDLYVHLNDISVSKHSEIVLFRLNDYTIFDPLFIKIDKDGKIEDQIFQPYEKSESQRVISAFEKMKKLNNNVSFPLVFNVKDQVHWMRARQIESNQNSLYIGVIVPESDFIGVLKKETGFFILFIISSLLLSAFLLFVVISKYGTQIKDLPQIHLDKKRAEADLLSLIKKGESKHLEFKSTIRYHLKAKRNDKAIEHAWLKGVAGFLNSEGGIILLGVSDDGSIHGTALDNFENDDKCILHIKNIISTGLGVESLGFLKIRVFEIAKEKVVVIEIESAKKPFYLKQNNEDLFYVRTGPSSTKMSVSETVDYVKNNF